MKSLGQGEKKLIYWVLREIIIQAMMTQQMLRHYHWKKVFKIPNDDITDRMIRLQKYYDAVDDAIKRLDLPFDIDKHIEGIKKEMEE